jgi:hypothetical protein
MRTYQHEIDTTTIRRVVQILPISWVIRELSERDYGIDLFVEIFEDSGLDKNGHKVSESSGAIFQAQLKGTDSAITPLRNGKISFQLSKSFMLYAERFSTPFFLFYIDVSSTKGKAYFLWIQRYVKDVLDFNSPTWRTDQQESYAVHIPPSNEIKLGLDKIKKIALRPRLLQETAEFRDTYTHLHHQLINASQGTLNINSSSLKQMRHLARKICNLKVIYKNNHCCVDKASSEDLLKFVSSLKTTTLRQKFARIPHSDEFELLAQSLENFEDIENFILENDLSTAY